MGGMGGMGSMGGMGMRGMGMMGDQGAAGAGAGAARGGMGVTTSEEDEAMLPVGQIKCALTASAQKSNQQRLPASNFHRPLVKITCNRIFQSSR